MVCNSSSSYVLPYTIIGYELIKLNLTIPLIQRDERQKRIIKLTVRDELRRKAKKRHRGRAGGGGSGDGRERETRRWPSPEKRGGGEGCEGGRDAANPSQSFLIIYLYPYQLPLILINLIKENFIITLF